MSQILVYPAGTGDAVSYAAKYLQRRKTPLIDHPSPDVTHLLLDVPVRQVPGDLLDRLPEDITIVGGNLNHREFAGYKKLDLLALEDYLAPNAAITAECAVRIAAARMKRVLCGADVLVIGWGRIGKCLCSLLRSIGCRVTVAVRKIEERAILEALGYRTTAICGLHDLAQYCLIFNTAPAPILDRGTLSHYPHVLKIDLASIAGMEGPDVIWARGLPGLYAPESSGALIAKTFLKEAGL